MSRCLFVPRGNRVARVEGANEESEARNVRRSISDKSSLRKALASGRDGGSSELASSTIRLVPGVPAGTRRNGTLQLPRRSTPSWKQHRTLLPDCMKGRKKQVTAAGKEATLMPRDIKRRRSSGFRFYIFHIVNHSEAISFPASLPEGKANGPIKRSDRSISESISLLSSRRELNLTRV